MTSRCKLRACSLHVIAVLSAVRYAELGPRITRELIGSCVPELYGQTLRCPELHIIS